MFLTNIIDSLDKNKIIFPRKTSNINNIIVEKSLSFNFSNFYYNKDYYSKFLEDLNQYLKFIELLSGSKAKIGSVDFSLSDFKKKKFFNLVLKIKAPIKKDPEHFFLLTKAFFIQMAVIFNFLKLDFSFSMGKETNNNLKIYLKNFHFFFSLLNNCWVELFRSSIYLHLFFSDRCFSDFFYKKMLSLSEQHLYFNEEV